MRRTGCAPALAFSALPRPLSAFGEEPGEATVFASESNPSLSRVIVLPTDTTSALGVLRPPRARVESSVRVARRDRRRWPRDSVLFSVYMLPR